MTRVVVIDPQPAVRAGLAMMLRTEPGLVPVGSAVGASDGLKLVERQRPDVVVLDRHLLDGDGLGTCARSSHPPRVVLYTAGADPTLPVIARVAGADGLVDKAAPAEELFEAIRKVARGGMRCRRWTARSSTPPRIASSRRTWRCWRCSWTARSTPTSPTRCG